MSLIPLQHLKITLPIIDNVNRIDHKQPPYVAASNKDSISDALLAARPGAPIYGTDIDKKSPLLNGREATLEEEARYFYLYYVVLLLKKKST